MNNKCLNTKTGREKKERREREKERVREVDCVREIVREERGRK